MPNAEYNARKFGTYLTIPFFATDLTTGASNSDLLCGVTANTLYIAPQAGSVVAISGETAVDVTAGSIALRAHKASTEFAQTGYPVATIDSTHDSTGSFADVREGALTFAAGDRLGISATSTTDLAPTNTVDVTAFLLIQLNPN
jgi:hypothetical protein